MRYLDCYASPTNCWLRCFFVFLWENATCFTLYHYNYLSEWVVIITTKEANTLVSKKGLSAVANWDWVLSNRRQEVSYTNYDRLFETFAIISSNVFQSFQNSNSYFPQLLHYKRIVAIKTKFRINFPRSLCKRLIMFCLLLLKKKNFVSKFFLISFSLIDLIFNSFRNTEKCVQSILRKAKGTLKFLIVESFLLEHIL